MEDFPLMAPEEQGPQAAPPPEAPTPADVESGAEATPPDTTASDVAPPPEAPDPAVEDGADRTDPALDHDASPGDSPLPSADEPANASEETAADGSESSSPVAAAEQLAQTRGETAEPGTSLEDQAAAQERQQAAELAAGAEGVTEEQRELIDLTEKAPAGARAGAEAPTVNGKMDQMSRRSGADALEGHFVTIDATVEGVEEAYRTARLIRDEGDERGAYRHTGFYGVYIQPADIDQETGIPTMAVVRLRDDTNALVRVPYESLSPAAPGGR